MSLRALGGSFVILFATVWFVALAIPHTLAAPTPAPTITAFTPTCGGAGTSVTIVGTDFTGATSVQFHGVPATFTVEFSTQIRATVPSGAA